MFMDFPMSQGMCAHISLCPLKKSLEQKSGNPILLTVHFSSSYCFHECIFHPNPSVLPKFTNTLTSIRSSNFTQRGNFQPTAQLQLIVVSSLNGLEQVSTGLSKNSSRTHGGIILLLSKGSRKATKRRTTKTTKVTLEKRKKTFLWIQILTKKANLSPIAFKTPIWT